MDATALAVRDISHLRACDVPFAEAVSREYSTADWAREELVSVVADVLRLAGKWTKIYTDPSCMELCEDELLARCRQKFITLLQNGLLKRFTKRGQLFGFLTTCFKHDICGLVHKNRYTLKRTGRKVPAKGSLENYDRSFKPEISLSDPDVSKTVERAVSHHDSTVTAEFKQDMREILTPVEFLVFCEHIEPSTTTLLYSTLDAWRGPSKKFEVVIRDSHRAAGLGISLPCYRQINDRLKSKIRPYMSEKSAELERGHHAAVGHLETIFGLQIPRSTEAMVVKRLLTVAARANYERVTPEVADLLRAVGARVPAVEQNGNLQCYGVLYQRNNRICLSCGLREACAVESANYGLDTITLSPKLLSASKMLVRTASITTEVPSSVPVSEVQPTEPSPNPLAPTNLFEEQLNTFLNDHFKVAKYGTDVYFRHKEKRGKDRSNLVWLGRRDDKLTIRFCKPSEKLAALLDHVGVSFYPPANASIEQIIALVNQHAAETLHSMPTSLPAAKMTSVPITPEQDQMLEQYLYANFKPAKFGPELYFRHKTRRSDGSVQLFWWNLRNGRKTIRFCKPKEDVAKRLEKIGTGYYPGPAMSYAEIIELIGLHGAETAGATDANFKPIPRKRRNGEQPAPVTAATVTITPVPALVVPRDPEVPPLPSDEVETPKRRKKAPGAVASTSPGAATVPPEQLQVALPKKDKSVLADALLKMAESLGAMASTLDKIRADASA